MVLSGTGCPGLPPTASGGESTPMANDDSFRTLIETAFPRWAEDVPGDDIIVETPPATVTGRADCCPAMPASVS